MGIWGLNFDPDLLDVVHPLVFGRGLSLRLLLVLVDVMLDPLLELEHLLLKHLHLFLKELDPRILLEQLTVLLIFQIC